MTKRVSGITASRYLYVLAVLALMSPALLAAQNNPLRIAILHWYTANQAASFAVGNVPIHVAFDGSSIWVVNGNDNTAEKLRASDGAVLGTFTVGTDPFNLAFDGANIWVTNSASNNVTKLRASDGAVLGTFTVGTQPLGIVRWV